MTRITASFLLLSVLALSKAALLVRAEEGATSGCVINTPKEITPRVGEDFKITWSGCKGHSRIQVRYGDPNSLDEEDDYACDISNMADKKYCYWVPKKAGSYSLSAKDDSGVETFTAKFQVEAAHNKVKRAFRGRGKGHRKGGRGGRGGKGKPRGHPKDVKFGHPKVEKVEKVLYPRSERDGHPKIEKVDHHKVEKIDHHKVEKIDHHKVEMVDHHPKVEKVEKVLYRRSERDGHPKIEKVDHHKVEKIDHHKVEMVDHHPKVEKVEKVLHPRSEKDDHHKVEKIDHPKVEKIEHPKVEKIDHPKVEKVGHPKVENKPEHEAFPGAPRRRSLPLRL